MKTITHIFAAACVGAALISAQAIAAGGALYPLDPWNTPVEGHMASEQITTDDSLKSGFGDDVKNPWDEDILTTE